eukprot:scaffold236_cov228-Pinguiococcus_pyrenoidosus.AAC.2
MKSSTPSKVPHCASSSGTQPLSGCTNPSNSDWPTTASGRSASRSSAIGSAAPTRSKARQNGFEALRRSCRRAQRHRIGAALTRPPPCGRRRWAMEEADWRSTRIGFPLQEGIGEWVKSVFGDASLPNVMLTYGSLFAFSAAIWTNPAFRGKAVAAGSQWRRTAGRGLSVVGYPLEGYYKRNRSVEGISDSCSAP